MKISDETLMAYADGELDAAARAAVDSAMLEDPAIAERVAEHRALRRRIEAAYSAELSEGVPDRLLAAARSDNGARGEKVVNIKDARESIERNGLRARRPMPQWRMTGSIAAAVIAGVGLGYFMWGHQEPALMRDADGALVAGGQLATALSSQLAAERSPASTVRIGVSFLEKSGAYCRTFELSGAVSPSGLACRHGGAWRIDALMQEPGHARGEPEYRTAGSPMPAGILKSVEDRIAGEPLDQAAEKAARDRGWK